MLLMKHTENVMVGSDVAVWIVIDLHIKQIAFQKRRRQSGDLVTEKGLNQTPLVKGDSQTLVLLRPRQKACTRSFSRRSRYYQTRIKSATTKSSPATRFAPAFVPFLGSRGNRCAAMTLFT
jgi:hypothetical protein